MINAPLIRYVRCAIKTILKFRVSVLAVRLFQIVFLALRLIMTLFTAKIVCMGIIWKISNALNVPKIVPSVPPRIK